MARLKFPSWRPLTWVIVLFNVLMLAWLVAGLGSVADECEGLTGIELDACEAGTAVGASIGAGIILTLWVFGDLILGVIWLVTGRSKRRECPACGREVKRGLTTCPHCGHDFAAAASR